MDRIKWIDHVTSSVILLIKWLIYNNFMFKIKYFFKYDMIIDYENINAKTYFKYLYIYVLSFLIIIHIKRILILIKENHFKNLFYLFLFLFLFYFIFIL